ncbi:MAG: glucose-1-phosphate adenylyltransferase subunit GlgD [Clostridiales bacterium]|nr:glucose-1-phosphate adenylyltransferase subunit GlgD [Candidatus Apopatocola equi]
MMRTIGLISTNYSVRGGYEQLCENRPAAAMPFGGRYRLMDFALSNLVNCGIRTVGVITPYYYRSILDHMGAGKAWSLDKKSGGLFVLPGTIYGFRDENSRFLLHDVIRNRQFLEQGDGDYVLCSDCGFIYNADYRPMLTQHENSGADITLLYKPLSPEERRSGNYLTADESGRVTALSRQESGEKLFLNCFVVTKSFLLRFLDNYRNMSHRDFLELLPALLSQVRVDSYPFTGFVGYTDGIADYLAASESLLRREVRQELFAGERQIYTRIHDEPPTAFSESAEVKNSVVSSGGHIGGSVENSVLFRGVVVEEGASVRGCILMEKTVIRAGAVLENVIADKHVTVGGGVTLRGTAEHPCLIVKGKSI